MLRIAIVGLSIEVMIASPMATDSAALNRYAAGQIAGGDLWMVRGVLQRLKEDVDVEAVPLQWANALPGGLLKAGAYNDVKQEALRLLASNGPFAGVVVVNHGALEVEGLGRDADSDFVSAVRAQVGPDVPIAVVLDLHGDMTPELLEAATIFSVLRTAPHRDDRETGYRGADQLLRVIRSGLKPKKAAVRVPILIPGETAVTSNVPARELYGSLANYDAKPGIMEANILVGFAWNDCPWTSATAIVVAESDAALAQKEALELGQRIWNQRAEFRLRMETAEVAEGLRLAISCREKPVYVSDSGDNTTAGAAGDLTLVLQAAISDPQIMDMVILGITAPRTVEHLLRAGVGAAAEIDLGAEHVSRAKTSRKVKVRVEACGHSLEVAEAQATSSPGNPWALVRIGNVLASFHGGRVGITTHGHIRAMGIDPATHKAYVVKLGYLFPQLEDGAARHILLLSDGASQLDMTRLTWNKLPRPFYPLDKDFTWKAEENLYGDR